jgi:hypothetical protein
VVPATGGAHHRGGISQVLVLRWWESVWDSGSWTIGICELALSTGERDFACPERFDHGRSVAQDELRRKTVRRSTLTLGMPFPAASVSSVLRCFAVNLGKMPFSAVVLPLPLVALLCGPP